MDDVLHVKLPEPLTIRKLVLQSAINSTEILRDYERLKEIRKEKQEQILKFKNILHQIKLSIIDLNNKLPAMEIEKPVELKKEPIKKAPKEIIKIEPTEIERLNKELMDIESKLKSLQI